MTTGVSIISWVNDPDEYMRMVAPSFARHYQVGEWETQGVVIERGVNARNIGQAYNVGRGLAEHELKVYTHQDVYIRDRSFLNKLRLMLSKPYVGMVGIIGSKVDTGGAFFHAPDDMHVGFKSHEWAPDTAQVRLVDCFLFATRLNIPFAEDYSGPHMAAEDYAMRVRQAGLEVWTMDAWAYHASPGKLDEGYWTSAKLFKKRWAHDFKNYAPPLSLYRKIREAEDTRGWGGAWEDMLNEGSAVRNDVRMQMVHDLKKLAK